MSEISSTSGSYSLEAVDVTVIRNNTVILDEASFEVEPGKLTAIIGPNGAGKTTLLRGLSGVMPESGNIYIGDGDDCFDMYSDPEYWLRRIGYIPVNNVLHPELTIEDALNKIGRLRHPEKSPKQIAEKVDSLLEQFEFAKDDDRRNRRIDQMSSGERKRANICAELLSDPPILLLDEPTSNLDPDGEEMLMRSLQKYAENNDRTVIVITHTLNTLDFCDGVIFIENSKIFSENSKIAGQDTPLQLLGGLEKASNIQHEEAKPLFNRWASVFKTYTTSDRERGTGDNRILNTEPNRPVAPPPPISPPNWQHQFRKLLTIYSKVRLSDRRNLIGTLCAGLSGILFFVIPDDAFLKPLQAGELSLGLQFARQNIYIISIIVTVIGLMTSYTQISREYHIYQHERLKGVSPSAYFMSKWVWLSTAVGILAPIILMIFIIFMYRQPLSDFPLKSVTATDMSWWEEIRVIQWTGLWTSSSIWVVLLTLILTCIAAVTLGLMISVLAGDSNRGYLYVGLAIVFTILFSGLVRNPRLSSVIDTLSFASVGKWGYEGFASGVDLYCWTDSWRLDELNSIGHILSIWSALILYIVVCMTLAIFILRLRDPWSRWQSNLNALLLGNWPSVVMQLSLIIMLATITVSLRQVSSQYNDLTYYSEFRHGGTGGFEYATADKLYGRNDVSKLQIFAGELSQPQCNDN